MKMLSGIAKLCNTKEYPFNNSKITVAFDTAFDDTDYTVYADVRSCVGEPGDIVIMDKARNGFKIAYTGSASEAEIYWKAVDCR